MYQSIYLCKPNRFNRFIITLLIILLVTICCERDVYSEEAVPVTTTHTITHNHTGSTSGGGGCYKKAVTETITMENRCKGQMIYFPEWNKTQCNICGASYDGNDSGRACYTTNPTQITKTTFKLGCGHEKDEMLGSFEGTIDNSSWAKEVILTLAISNPEYAISDNPFLINDTSIAGNTFIIRENGSYTSIVALDSNSFVEPIVWNIQNIDNTAPAMDISYDQTPDIEFTFISISASDLQPDGSNGCGLASEAYSYDGGKNWTPSPEHKVTKNGEYSIMVRDALNNISSSSVTINNIKPPAPPKDNAPDNTPDDNKPDITPGSKPAHPDNGNNPDVPSGGPSETVTPPGDNSPKPSETPKDPTATKKPDKPKPISSTDDSDEITEPDRTGIIPFPIPKPVTYKKTVIVKNKKLKAEQKPAEITSIEEPVNDNNIERIIILILLALLGLLLLLLLLFLLYRVVRIYNYKGNDQYKLMGFGFIKCREEMFMTSIKEDIIDKCDTNLLSVKPSLLFFALHKNEDITIYLPDKQAHQAQVSKTIKIHLKKK